MWLESYMEFQTYVNLGGCYWKPSVRCPFNSINTPAYQLEEFHLNSWQRQRLIKNRPNLREGAVEL